MRPPQECHEGQVRRDCHLLMTTTCRGTPRSLPGECRRRGCEAKRRRAIAYSQAPATLTASSSHWFGLGFCVRVGVGNISFRCGTVPSHGEHDGSWRRHAAQSISTTGRALAMPGHIGRGLMIDTCSNTSMIHCSSACVGPMACPLTSRLDVSRGHA